MTKKMFEMHAELCKIFTNPIRLEIIDLLQNNEKSVSALAESVGVSQSNVSQHLTILKDRGVVETRRKGNNIYYMISNPKILDACRLMREVLLEKIEENNRIVEAIKR